MKRGQLKLSFGMIFSIILIVVFLIFAFYAIRSFMDLQKNVKLAQFVDDVKTDVSSVRKGLQGSKPVQYVIPTNVEYVCFVNFEEEERGDWAEKYFELQEDAFGDETMMFYPYASGKDKHATIPNLDIEKTTEESNPLCIENAGGKIEFTIKIEYGERLVTITE